MIRVVTKPTSKLLLDPEEVRTRLKAPSSEASAISRIVARASSILVGQLRFDPWYQEVEERFDQQNGNTLNLSARPFVRLVSVVDADGEPLLEADNDFDVRYTGRKSGEVYLFRRDTWELGGWPDPEADWKVRYFSGWWLPGMTGSKPADVDELPEDLAEAAWIVCQDRYSADSLNPAVKVMSKGSARVEFRDRGMPSGDRLQVLPPEAQMIVDTYQPLAMGV